MSREAVKIITKAVTEEVKANKAKRSNGVKIASSSRVLEVIKIKPFSL